MRFIRRFGSSIVFIIVLLASGLILWKHDPILDWSAARNYQPSSTISQYVLDTSMTPESKRLFYANRPLIEDKIDFNLHCSDTAAEVATLGCYTGDRRGIYIYHVTDARLNGVQQVTAAHEMLHQAYQRLGTKEKRQVDGWLKAAQAKVQDPAILSQLDSYKKTEPGQLNNELHSILGTQVGQLSPQLENYYKRYFTDRSRLVQYYSQYQSEFDKRRQQIADYDSRLGAMASQIKADKQTLVVQEKSIDQHRNQLDDYLHDNKVSEYNAAVPAYNAAVAAYRDKVKAVNALISQYNSLLDERNAVAVQERELQQALDSHIESVTSQ
jgi:hypothetical protein